MPPIPGVVYWHHYLARQAKTLKAALSKLSKTVDAQLGKQQPAAQLEPILVRDSSKQSPHPLSRIRQNQARWFSTARRINDQAVRSFTSSAAARSGNKYNRASFPVSRASTYIQQSSGRAPFASTLRPNLTGGTLGRTAGGYTLGSGRVGGARYFSHGPACQAQVVQNVSQGVRAFLVGGHKAHFDGISPVSGGKTYKTISLLQEETGRKLRQFPKATPGSHIAFRLNPTVTALTPLDAFTGYSRTENMQSDHLNTDGLLDVLSADFSRALKDLSAVLNDLRRLSSLGDLPLTCSDAVLRVHFPGCDAETVERLCEELNVTRGNVVQDADFDLFAGTEIALLFPFAPSAIESAEEFDDMYESCIMHPPQKKRSLGLRSMLSPSSYPAYSIQSAKSDFCDDDAFENPWMSSEGSLVSPRTGSCSLHGSDEHDPLEYQGFEGIYRFIEELDSVGR